MHNDPRLDALFNRLGAPPQKPAGLLQRALAVIATLAVFALALFFSVVVFAVVVTLGVALWGWFWWKTRELRRAMREQAQMDPRAQAGGARRPPPAGGMVIEGEVIREVREQDEQPPR